jgi:capsular polysaccharide biosynthesis protein
VFWFVSRWTATLLANRSGKILDRNDLIQKSKREGEYISLESEQTYVFDQSVDSCCFEFPVGKYTTPRQFVSSLSNCKVIGNEPTFFTEKNELILELANDNLRVAGHRLSNVRIQDIAALSKNPVRIKSLFPLVRYNHNDPYYHWWMKQLGSLRRLAVYENVTNKRPTILIESDPASWVVESIDVLGFSDYDILRYSNKPIVCEELVIPSLNYHASDDYRPNIRDYQWIRDRALENVTTNTQSYASRIYISRQKARNRHVKNEEEIIDFLREYGFERVFLEDMSIEDQVRMFSNVKMIIAPHGGGLTNVLFSRNCSVLEFIPENNKAGFFKNLCSLLDLEYKCIECETGGTVAQNMSVDISRVESWLKNNDFY